jgi:hypothetical protein
MTENSRTIRSVRTAGALVAGTLLIAGPAMGQARAERDARGGLRITSKQEKVPSSRGGFTGTRGSGRMMFLPPPADPAPPADDVRGPEAPFRIWSWQAPRGQAADMEHVLKFVRVKVDAVPTPEAAADRVVEAILNRGLEHEEIAIILQHFGMGDGGSMDTGYPLPPAPALFWHWNDGLRHVEPRGTPEQQEFEVLGDSDASPKWWQTPWMSHGIAESREWMDRFIARYKERQASDPAIPDPSRFHFDSENHTTPRRIWATREFHAMRNDLRWTREEIPGFDGKTMADLYAEAGSPALDAGKPAHRNPNQAWRSWYEGICIQSADAAMDAAAYQPIREAWPNARSSNWRTSDAYDGVDGRFRTAVGGAVVSVNRAFGDMQAPVLYGKHPDFDTSVEGRERVMTNLRRRIEDAMFSFDGPHVNFAPWTYVPGQRVSNSGRNFRVQEDQLRRTIVALRSRGISELLLWSSGDTQAGTRWWDEAADAIRDATALSFRTARVTEGTAPQSGSLSDVLALRHRDEVMVGSAAADGGHVAELRLEFRHRDGRFAPEDVVVAAVYARTVQPGVTATVSIHDQRSGLMIPLGAVSMDEIFNARAREFRFETSAPAVDAMLDTDGSLELVLRFTSPNQFTAMVDHATVFVADPAPERK